LTRPEKSRGCTSAGSAANTDWALRQPKPAPKVVTFGNRHLEKDTGTVSETVSESIARAVKNSGELKQIILDFTGDFAIFLTLNHAFQVAERRWKLASYEVAGVRVKNNSAPDGVAENWRSSVPCGT
jgi:hypothetical protein